MSKTKRPDQILLETEPHAITAPTAPIAATAKHENEMIKRVNRCIAAMSTFTTFVYTKQNGIHLYLTPESYLTITGPFTRTGYQHYSVSRSDGRALNKLLQALLHSDQMMPWLIYEPLATSWYVDTKTYPNRSDAVKWLKFADLPNTFPTAWYSVTNSRYVAQ